MIVDFKATLTDKEDNISDGTADFANLPYLPASV